MPDYAPRHFKNVDKDGTLPDTGSTLPDADSAWRDAAASSSDRSADAAPRRRRDRTATRDSDQAATRDSASRSSRSSRSRSHRSHRNSDRAATRASSRAATRDGSSQSATAPNRSQIALALGIVFIAIALAIATFLVYKYFSASKMHEENLKISGLDLGVAGDIVVPTATLEDLTVNWDALRTINPEIVGWVMIPGTRVNYPIVQAGNNDYYLNHLFDKTPSDVGAIFLDCDSAPTIDGWNNLIYGHNLLDGSMFAELKAYRDRDFFDEHKTVLLATPAKSYRLEVVAALVCDADDKIRRFSFTDRADFDSYIEMLLSYSVLSELEPGTLPENLYCFATCTDTNYSKRTLIMASIVETQDVE
jgi:sortase B